MANPLFFIIIAATIFLAIVPLFVYHAYILHLFILFFLYGTLSGSWNLLAGFSGQISLGLQLFLGIGAYLTGFIWLAGLPVFPSILGGGLGAAMVAALVGYPATRMRGAAYAIGTWMFAEAARIIFLNSDLLGGAIGVSLPIFGAQNKALFYYYPMFFLFATMFAIHRIVGSKFGYGLMSIREDEDAAKSLGINTIRHRIIVLVISGFIAGAGGGLYAVYNGFIQPFDVFSFIWMLDIIIITILGGIGTIFGPIIGTGLFLILTEYLRYKGVELHLILEGIFLLVVALFFRKGVWGHLAPALGRFGFYKAA